MTLMNAVLRVSGVNSNNGSINNTRGLVNNDKSSPISNFCLACCLFSV